MFSEGIGKAVAIKTIFPFKLSNSRLGLSLA